MLLCKYHFQGRCDKAAACDFAHGEDEQVKPPTYQASHSSFCALLVRGAAQVHDVPRLLPPRLLSVRGILHQSPPSR